MKKTHDIKKVLIVDDHVSVQESLTAVFSKVEEFTVVGCIPSAAFAEAYCGKLEPDIVIMDICTENGASGLVAAQELRAKYLTMKIIIMTAFDEITYMPRAKEAGADAFIYKSKSLDHFVEVAKGVLRGEQYFPEPKRLPVPSGEAPLTEREMEVLRLICRHMSSKEIGEELFISENTVKYHKANILAKTGFSKAIDLAFYMISNGWINPLY